MTPRDDDTIAAISTPPGLGAIGIVRISGPQAPAIAARLFRAADGQSVEAMASHRLVLGRVHDDGRPLDEVLLAVMRAPRSYTRQDVVELHCHGGAAAVRAVLELALAAGARLAGPGEFTRRALLAGRIDLTQAEAVLDLIQARTRAGLRAAQARLAGRLGHRAAAVRRTVTAAAAELEAAIDFPDEQLEGLVAAARRRAAVARRQLAGLLAGADAGRLYRQGLAVAIAGRPNVGKSSLFNRLLREARAIVSDEPGTTRDVVAETIAIHGVPLRLSDSAGLRQANGEAERQGVERAERAMAEADLVLLVLDASQPLAAGDRAALASLRAAGAEWLAVANKADLPARLDPAVAGELLGEQPLAVSAKTGAGIEALEAALAERLLGPGLVPPEDALVASAREADCLRRCDAALERFAAAVDAGTPPEAAALDLRDAAAAIGELLGDIAHDELLDHIFSRFCIGK